MLNKKKIKSDAINFGETTAKAFAFHNFNLITIASQIAVFWLSTKGILFPGQETMQSIAGTGAEIIAGLYGLTLAGYTFFLSRIDTLMASDNTLDHVVASIKSRFKYLIWYITLNVLMTLLVSMVLMYLQVPDGTEYAFYYRLFCNEFVVFLGFSVVLILYYSILVVDPNCIEKEAAKVKKRISRAQLPEGSAVEFIALYDKIESRCNNMIPQNVLNQIHENKGSRFEYTISILREQKMLSLPLLHDVSRIHRYYECVINCADLSVSLEMCVLARHVLKFLEQMPNLPAER